MAGNGNTPAQDPRAVAPSSWGDAWRISPGPESLTAQGWLAAKGFAMGVANIIPGVSGGTLALITHIYAPLLAAIASVDRRALRLLARLRLKALLAHVHMRFLLPLGVGVVASTLGTAKLIHFLLADYKVQTWGFFFGLILASVWAVGREVGAWRPRTVLALWAGVAGAWIVVGLVPVRTPDAAWFVFFAGAVAICAMILPGLSGSFLLLILGKYEYVIAAIENPFTREHLVRIVVFGAGCAGGLVAFSRILDWCLHRCRDATMAALTGIMLGALRKVWPWKETLQTRIVRGEERILEEANILPPAIDAEFAITMAVMILGAVLVVALERTTGPGRSPAAEA
jgi:putative membrane protein